MKNFILVLKRKSITTSFFLNREFLAEVKLFCLNNRYDVLIFEVLLEEDFKVSTLDNFKNKIKLA